MEERLEEGMDSTKHTNMETGGNSEPVAVAGPKSTGLGVVMIMCPVYKS